MNFDIPDSIAAELRKYKTFLKTVISPRLSHWYKTGDLTKEFFQIMGEAGWYGFNFNQNSLIKKRAIREALLTEALSKVSPGLAVSVLSHIDLGFMALYLFGSDELKSLYAESALKGETLMCIGNTENIAGSDVAGIRTTATRVDDGWVINGTKAYVTNGLNADLAVVTAESVPSGSRNQRLSMFLVDMKSKSIQRKKLKKQVWIPSDLTRIEFKDVFVPGNHLLGKKGRGLQQVLTLFTYSRVPISALTLGTAMGAFHLAFKRALNREVFHQKIIQYQAKSFEAADFYTRISTARLMLFKACNLMDKGEDFRMESSMAKYLAVSIARETTSWAADLYGAASVIYDHPIHKFPMDAWGASLGEGTQDVQKLIVFRALMQKYQNDSLWD